MNQSQTPETDAALLEILKSRGVLDQRNAPENLVMLTRKLEIERDEARAQLQAEREIADKLAHELSCLANWRDVHNIVCHYDPSPLAKWKEARKP